MIKHARLNVRPTAISDDCKSLKAELLNSRQISIDAFLAHRSDMERVGKIAIALALLKQESLTDLLKPTDDDWYSYLVQAMRTPFEDVRKNQISFVTFNYDRSLELALFLAFKSTHRLGDADAWDLVKAFPIVHVYGSLGSLADSNSSSFVPYGAGRGASDLHDTEFYEYVNRAADQIIVMNEHRGTSPEFDRAKELMAEAEVLGFLGFAFDELNVERLGGRAIVPWSQHLPPRPFAATAYGLLGAEFDEVAEMISHRDFSSFARPHLYEEKCLRMLRATGLLKHK